MNVYLVRHAQSQANLECRYQGHSWDTPLTKLGQRQAGALAHRLKDVPIDAVLTSPLIRARQTAGPIAQAHHLASQVESNLIETDHGQWEGKTFTELESSYPRPWQLWQTHPSQVVFPGGDAFTATAQRAVIWWNQIIDSGKNIVAVTHDNIIQIILAHLHHFHLDHIYDFRIKNASLTHIEANSPPIVHTIGDISHLAGLDVK